MVLSSHRSLIAAIVLAISFKSAMAINCYQCSGTDPENPFICNEFLNSGEELELKSCDNVYGANYCVKHTGRFEGGIGTRRFCSGLDLGNYCNYVQNKGDQLEYRSCIFTCGTDGCNASSSIAPIKFVLMPSILIAVFMKRLTT